MKNGAVPCTPTKLEIAYKFIHLGKGRKMEKGKKIESYEVHCLALHIIWLYSTMFFIILISFFRADMYLKNIYFMIKHTPMTR